MKTVQKNPLVSIVVPVYNVEQYLKRCVKSLLNQTYERIQILLIDDGSTDTSDMLCDELKNTDSRIEVIHKKNAGLGMARNTGLDNIKGKYVLFVDSDDYIEKDAVKILMEKAIKYSADVVATQFIYNGEKEKTEVEEGIYHGEKVKKLIPCILGTSKKNNDQLNVSSCTKLYNVEFLNKYKLRFPSERQLIWEDLAFNYDVFCHAKNIYVMDYAYYNYLYNEQSLTHKYNPQKFEQIMKMYEYMFKKVIRLQDRDAFARLNNMFIGNIRTCMKLEAFYSDENGIGISIKNIKRYCDDNRLQALVSAIPREETTKQQEIYNIFIKKKNARMLYWLARLQNIRKGKKIN